MNTPTTFQKTLELPVSQSAAFAYHERPGALARLIPPWENIRIAASDGSLRAGSRVQLKIGFLGLSYLAKHTVYDPPQRFQDVQERGPFASWQHDHRFDVVDDQHSTLTDHIEYRLPLGFVGQTLGNSIARGKLESMFRYRHSTTLNDLQLTVDYPMSPQRIAISGSTGLLGTQLSAQLQLLGHHVDRIVRHSTDADDEIAVWDEDFQPDKLRRVDTVIHLAGKSIASGRWSKRLKQQIRDSRIDKTRALCERLAALGDDKPSTLLCASATGFYGSRGEEELTEDSAAGEGFLPDVSQAWEAACQPAVDAGIRVVSMRFGMILSPQGGALKSSLLPAKFAGGRLGNGQQWWSWIAIDDVLGAIYHALATPTLSGPVNFVSPQPLRNVEFAKTLGRVLKRPALFPAPAVGLRLALGEMADALLLTSARVQPNRLQQSGYSFRFPELEGALRHLLGR